MSLYDGLDIEDKSAPSAKADIAGWGSSLKLLETQKQLQEKKLMLQNISKKKNIATPTPANVTKNKKAEEMPPHSTHQTVRNIEGTGMLGGQFIMSGDIGFIGVTDEYDPAKPNDYEKITKSKKQNKDHEEEGDRRSRRDDRKHRNDDYHHDDDCVRGSRPSGWRSYDNSSCDGRKRSRYEDEEEFGSRKKKGKEEERVPEPTPQKAAIAPPQSLLEFNESNGPILNKPDPVGSKFGMGGSVASKIMARMGYKEGQGLGRQEQGMSIALQVEKTSKKIGKIIHEKDLHRSQDMSVPRAEMSNANLLRNPSKVIVLRNMVGPGEVDDTLEAEVSEECSKYGKVVKCMIYEIQDCCEEEAVRIFVEFDRLEASIKAVVDLNGRFFAGRVVKGNFYDNDRFKSLDLGGEIE